MGNFFFTLYKSSSISVNYTCIFSLSVYLYKSYVLVCSEVWWIQLLEVSLHICWHVSCKSKDNFVYFKSETHIHYFFIQNCFVVLHTQSQWLLFFLQKTTVIRRTKKTFKCNYYPEFAIATSTQKVDFKNLLEYSFGWQHFYHMFIVSFALNYAQSPHSLPFTTVESISL